MDLNGYQSKGAEWAPYTVNCIRRLWSEEEQVAKAVEKSVLQGIEF